MQAKQLEKGQGLKIKGYVYSIRSGSKTKHSTMCVRLGKQAINNSGQVIEIDVPFDTASDLLGKRLDVLIVPEER